MYGGRVALAPSAKFDIPLLPQSRDHGRRILDTFSSFHCLTCQGSLLKSLGYGNDGFYSQGLLYGAMAIAIFLVPAFIERITPRLTLFAGACCYWCAFDVCMLPIGEYLIPGFSLKFIRALGTTSCNARIRQAVVDILTHVLVPTCCCEFDDRGARAML